jgi:hypothetical protein
MENCSNCAEAVWPLSYLSCGVRLPRIPRLGLDGRVRNPRRIAPPQRLLVQLRNKRREGGSAG